VNFQLLISEGSLTQTVDFSIPFLQTHKCLIIASTGIDFKNSISAEHISDKLHPQISDKFPLKKFI
jgi:hypothetical protein